MFIRLIFVLFFCSVSLHAAVLDVSSAKQLKAAIKKAEAGDTIRLAPGSYGNVLIEDKLLTSFLTITSRDTSKRAELSGLEIKNSIFIKIDDLKISAGAQLAGIRISNRSSYVEVNNSEIHGPLVNRRNPSFKQIQLTFGVRIDPGASRIKLFNNYLHDALDGSSIFGVQNIEIANNRCDYVQVNCFKLGDIKNLLFENNEGVKHIYTNKGASPSFVTAIGSIKNSIFRGNVAIYGTEPFDGFNFAGEFGHVNNVVEENIVYTGDSKGIFFNSKSSNNVAYYNTILGSPRLKGYPTISGVDLSEFNILSGAESQSGKKGADLVLQHESKSLANHYNSVFRAATKGSSLKVRDLTMVEGLKKGAYRLVEEMTGSVEDPILLAKKKAAEEAKKKQEQEDKREAAALEKKRLEAEVERKRKAAAEAERDEKARKAQEAERKRLADVAEKKRLAREAERKRLAKEAELKRLAKKKKVKKPVVSPVVVARKQIDRPLQGVKAPKVQRSRVAFLPGDRVTLSTKANIRTSARLGRNISGANSAGSSGTVMVGPNTSGAYTWYEVNFDSGADGWVASRFLNREVLKAPKRVISPAPKTVPQIVKKKVQPEVPKTDRKIKISRYYGSGGAVEKAFDGNLSTAWETVGKRKFIHLATDNPEKIGGVKIAFKDGVRKRYLFDVLLITTDGRRLPVIKNRTSASTNSLKTYSFTSSTGKGVRIVCNGNDGDNENAIVEVQLLRN